MKIILQKPIQTRTQHEVDQLVEGFKNVEFFKQKFDLKSKVFKEVVNAIKIKQFSKGKAVFNYGDVGDYFYVIL